MNYYLTLFTVILFLFSACSESQHADQVVDETVDDALSTDLVSAEQLAFWDNLREHCGNAYVGELADATPFYQTFEADQIRIHVRDCTDDLTHISLHIDDNHSRNLLLTKEEGTLLLKHDHRNQDGTEEEITPYGGFAPKPGLETRQIFWADEHTAEILPERSDNFWFLDFMDDSTLAYGVHWPTHGNSIRMEFDISELVEAPPAPWGY
ncbi:hypothetical protein BH23BAC3_BH23BAC3_33840 [soil metagenome]